MAIAAPLMLLAASVSAPVTRSVGDVAANISALDGQVVRVRGWIDGCDGGFHCTIGDAREEDAHRPSLSIDHVEKFEPELARRDGLQIMLDARVSAKCRSGEFICTHRGLDLVPIRIIETPGTALPRQQ